MPLIVVTLLAAIVCGLWLPARAALAVTAAFCAATLAAFGWAVLDGQGSDPWWLLLIAGGACALALTVVRVLSGRRRHVAA